MRTLSVILSVCALLFVPLSPANAALMPASYAPTEQATRFQFSTPVPPTEARAAESTVRRRVNAPYAGQSINFYEAAIFWFGQVNATDNYADVRMAYTDSSLHVRVSVIDRRLWNDPAPAPDALSDGDSVSLYLHLSDSGGNGPDANSYRFTGQLTWGETEREGWQAVYRGNGSGWSPVSIPFSTTTTWRGDAINNDVDDRGWTIDFSIPFTSLGLPTAPSRGTLWGLGVALHDRDDAAGTPIAEPTWPEVMDGNLPATWGELAFGLPAYIPPPLDPAGTTVIRQGLNGMTVTDAAVGGGTTCGEGLDFWNAWGEQNYAGQDSFNVQNQADVADWPCFSKYYVTFPLDGLPPTSSILSATLSLYQIGSAGAGAETWPSFIQVLTASEDWNESSLTWNNAPLAGENAGGAWVNALPTFPGFPGVLYHWDVSLAAARARDLGQPLRLILYSADEAYHSGRYFTASDAADWNAEGRPALSVTWGWEGASPVPTPVPDANVPSGPPRAFLPLLR